MWATSFTRKRLLFSRHQQLSVAHQRLLDKVGQKRRKKSRKGGQKARQPHIGQGQSKLTGKFNFEIVFLWGHPIRPFWLVNVSLGHSNHIQKGVFVSRPSLKSPHCYTTKGLTNAYKTSNTYCSEHCNFFSYFSN